MAGIQRASTSKINQMIVVLDRVKAELEDLSCLHDNGANATINVINIVEELPSRLKVSELVAVCQSENDKDFVFK